MDMLPFTSSEGNEHTAFSDITEIFNPNFNSLQTVTADDDLDEVFIGTQYVWMFLHSALIFYLFLRVNIITGAIAALPRLIENLPMAEAAGKSSSPDCILPNEAYYLAFTYC